MNQDLKFSEALAEAIAILESHAIPYHLTCGLAAINYGEWRSTSDADAVVRLG